MWLLNFVCTRLCGVKHFYQKQISCKQIYLKLISNVNRYTNSDQNRLESNSNRDLLHTPQKSKAHAKMKITVIPRISYSSAWDTASVCSAPSTERSDF